MWRLHSVGAAVGAVLVGLVFLGAMVIFWKVAERKGRPLSHTLLDFSFVSLFLGCGSAFLFGSVPSAHPEDLPNIFPQFSQLNSLTAFAVACGIVYTFADVTLQQAMPLVGIVTAAGISNALRISIAVLTNYWLDARLDRGATLFPGLGLALIAIATSAAAQISHAQSKAVVRQLPAEAAETGLSVPPDRAVTDVDRAPDAKLIVRDVPQPADLGKGNALHEDGDAADISCLPAGSQGIWSPLLWKGLGLCFVSGTCYGLYSPAFSVSTNDPWHLEPGSPPLSEWQALFWLYIGLWVTSFTINMRLLYKPMAGPPSNFVAYLKDNKRRGWAIASAFVGNVAAVAELIGGQAAGFSMSSLVAAYPLITTCVGILAFGEFRGASRWTATLLLIQFCSFVAAVGLIASSGNLRYTRDQAESSP